jgi:hypothetical protein
MQFQSSNLAGKVEEEKVGAPQLFGDAELGSMAGRDAASQEGKADSEMLGLQDSSDKVSQITSSTARREVNLLSQQAAQKRETYHKMVELQDMERRKEVLDQLEEAKASEQETLRLEPATDGASEAQLKSKDDEIAALRAQLNQQTMAKEESEKKQQDEYKRLEDELKAKIMMWQQVEQEKIFKKQVEDRNRMESDLLARQEKLAEELRQQEISYQTRLAEEKRIQGAKDIEAERAKERTRELEIQNKRMEEQLREEKEKRDGELREKMRVEREAQDRL